MEHLIKQTDKKLIKIQLNGAKNISKLIETLFKPIEIIKEEKEYESIEDAIKDKFNAEQYLKKYGTLTLNTMTKEIENILNDTNQ